ncbi:MAG TPA: energy transducer TonB [Steroidobacteraceae bacterium]
MRDLRGGRWICLLCAALVTATGFAAATDSTTDKAAVQKQKERPFSIVHDTELGRTLTATLDACNYDWPGTHQLPAFQPAPAVPAATEAPHTITFPPIEYSHLAERKVQEGSVLLEMLIGTDGYARYVHVTSALPASENTELVERAILAARRGTFSPARRAGLAVAAWWPLKISVGGRSFLNDEGEKKLLMQATAGDPASVMLMSYLDGIERQGVGFSHEARRDFLVYAALAGERSARMRLAEFLQPSSCKIPALVTEYFTSAARHGDSELELMQATQLLMRGDLADRHDIGVLLHGATNSIKPFVQIWAAGILATAPDGEVRDPPAALATARSIKDDGYPESQELLAAAAAANGDLKGAISAELVAIKRAKQFHWDDAHMQERLASYQEQRPWTGYLCDCAVLVPGVGTN